MADSLNVKISFVATTTDNAPYSSLVMEFAGLPYDAFVYMEGIGVKAIDELNKTAQARVTQVKQ